VIMVNVIVANVIMVIVTLVPLYVIIANAIMLNAIIVNVTVWLISSKGTICPKTVWYNYRHPLQKSLKYNLYIAHCNQIWSVQTGSH
jgi:hypothetical protein